MRFAIADLTDTRRARPAKSRVSPEGALSPRPPIGNRQSAIGNGTRHALAWGLLAALVAAGCGPSSALLRREIQRGDGGTYVSGVPFVAQRNNWCGPAALASVVQHHGLPLTQEEIAREVYLPSIAATLTIDLQRCAQSHGLWCHSGKGSADEVQQWLDRGVPVIALLKLGPLAGGMHHYVAVTGYHARRGYFIAHTGYAPNRPISFERFARELRAGGGWLLAACPPDRVAWPLSAHGHSDLGLLFERAGRLERAEAEYACAVAADPTVPVFHFNLGNVLFATGQRAAAERAYRQAIQLQPAFADAHNNLASLLLDLRRPHEALSEARRAIDIDGPRVAYYYDTLGRAFTALRRYADATQAFRCALNEARNDAGVLADARLGLIEALIRVGERDEALAEKDRLLASTTDPQLHERAAQLLR